jgi:hypothetical protein
MHDYLKNLIRMSDSMTVIGLRYIDYKTGHYGSGKYPGVSLQFICDQSGDDYYVIFNACLIRKRSVGKYKKGTPLPDKHFSVGLKSSFVAMWRSTQILLPKSLTAFHDCMGKLKSIPFKAETSKGNRLDAASLKPMIFPDNSQTNPRQIPDKNLTTIPDKDTSQTPKGPQQGSISTTCPNNYVISKQVREYTSNHITPIDETERIQNQTSDEWLAEYQQQWKIECDELF